MTTTIRVDFDPTIVIQGTESFPVLGDLLTEEEVRKIYQSLKGFAMEGQCVEKSQCLQQVMEPSMALVFGGLMVIDTDGRSSYEYQFNPPFELHAWLLHVPSPGYRSRGIVDISLPGVIMRGQKFEDDEGPILQGRKPVVLAGPPPDWLRYDSHRLFYQGKTFEPKRR